MTKKTLYPALGMTAATLLFVSIAAAQSADAKSSATPATTAKPAATTPAARVDQWPKATGLPAAKNSGHATEALDAIPKASAAANNTSHETVEYKDPEDMTTRYRPGNNKTTSTLPPTAPTATPASDADAKKHVSNIKWQDRAVGLPACDGASKDAAKCAVAPPTAPATAKPAATAAQDTKHTGKVDSFTVKQ